MSCRGKRLIWDPNCTDRFWAPTRPLVDEYHGPFLGVRRRKRAAYHSPPSGTEVKNDWSYTSALPICLYVVDRDKFTFIIIIIIIIIINIF
jgi:hypothetical protein